MVDEYNHDVHFVEIDIEEDQEIAEAAGIMGTPCVQFFKNKEMLRLGNILSVLGLYRLLCSGLAKDFESVQDYIRCEDEERVPGIH